MAKQKVAEQELSAEQMKQRIAELEAQIAANRSVPEYSTLFVNAKDLTPIKWSNLSETKRHFEQKHRSIVVELCNRAGVTHLTSKQFHDELRKALEVALGF